MTDTPHSPRVTMTAIGSTIGRLQAMRAELPPGQAAALEELLRAAGVAETNPPQYNPFLPGVHTDPHPHYQALREHNPAHYSTATRAWVLTRYADVLAAFKDPRLSSQGNLEGLMTMIPEEERAGVRTVATFITSTLNQQDPPVHTHLRRIAARALATPQVTARRPAIQRTVAGLLDAIGDRPRFDMLDDFAIPLPLLIAVEMLDIPAADRDQILDWGAAVILTFSEGFAGTEAMRRGEAAVPQLVQYFREVVANRRAIPGDDAISAMLAEPGATDDEVITLTIQFLMGIYETVRQVVAVGLHSLLSAPGAYSRLAADPALVPGAVEELLRYDVISPIIQRTAREDAEVAGCPVRAGQQVMMLLGAANRDPERFTEADTLDIERRPNPHIAFGAGIHTCPGAALARVAAGAALSALIARYPDLRLAGPPVWREEGNLRGLVSLPVARGAEVVAGAPR